MDLTKVSVIERRTVRGQPTEVVVSQTPHIGIKRGEGPDIWLCEGNAYSAGGVLIREKDYPSWLWDEVGKLSDAALRSVRWNRQAEPSKPQERIVPAKFEVTHTTDDIDEALALADIDAEEKIVKKPRGRRKRKEEAT
jgi:hypothetical protein